MSKFLENPAFADAYQAREIEALTTAADAALSCVEHMTDDQRRQLLAIAAHRAGLNDMVKGEPNE